jgi:hypothetical protein
VFAGYITLTRMVSFIPDGSIQNVYYVPSANWR